MLEHRGNGGEEERGGSHQTSQSLQTTLGEAVAVVAEGGRGGEGSGGGCGGGRGVLYFESQPERGGERGGVMGRAAIRGQGEGVSGAGTAWWVRREYRE